MAENKQSERSRQWISDALVDLMQKKPYAHITVKDITDRAGVARLTFYRHFETKEDILRYRFQILFSGYLSELETSSARNLLEALSLCFDYWRRNGQQLHAMVENRLEALLYEPFGSYLETMLEKYHAEKEMTSLQKQFLVGGLYFAMIEYVVGDSGLSPHQAALSVLEMLKVDMYNNCWLM